MPHSLLRALCTSAGLPGSGRNPDAGLGSLVVAELGVDDASGSSQSALALSGTTGLTGKDLSGFTVTAEVRQSVGSGASVRFTLIDADDNESATQSALVSDEFESLSFRANQFSRPIGGALSIDLSRIVNLRFEFLSPSGVSAPAQEFDLDNVALVPEPSEVMLRGLSMLTLVGLAGRRRSTTGYR